jgi:predicted acylesterase/phospholipase RssA
VTRAGLACLAYLAAALAGCSGPAPRPSDAVGPLSVTRLADAGPLANTVPVPVARNESTARPPAADGRRFHILALSAGGSDGAYAAGALVGWSEAGTRPRFDVVTGVSTGALIAVLAFLGPDYDHALERLYTKTTDADLFDRRSAVRALLSDALADPRPLARKLEKVVDGQFLAAVAAEHARGRRLYVGTTHLDALRPVVWDLGAVASRGDLTLFRQVLLASAAAPGFFPPVTIPVEVDGREFRELHIDGAVTASLFFRPPHMPPAEAARLDERPLAGSDLYVLVSGKLYPDPISADARLLPLLADAVTGLVAAKTRADACGLHALAEREGMRFRLGSIPADVAASPDPLAFDPADMGRLFEEGRRRARAGTLWRAAPPGAGPDEEAPDRAGARLTARRARDGSPPAPDSESTPDAPAVSGTCPPEPPGRGGPDEGWRAGTKAATGRDRP